VNKNLDVHMRLNNNNINFKIVDQDNRPVVLSWCLLEFILFTENYFIERSETVHKKRQ